ncbi:MAG: DNA-directed RNA polymerase subunit beta, partial [Clostridia bacterium]|nr:DNA-directed RNA polymerase subunit beta [Clostridia bacterium]
MVHEVDFGLRKRMSFSRIDEVLEMPDLIEVQKDSYRRFVEEGLMEVLKDFSPIRDFAGKMALEFCGYNIDFEHPKYTIDECREQDVTYSAPLRVTVRLVHCDPNDESVPGEIKTQDVFMGDFPIMTPQGTFIINGAERVIVSQLVRSPGVYLSEAIDNKDGKSLFASQIIPNRGSWLEFETDSNTFLYAKINRQRKIYVTTFIRALGFDSDAQILELFGEEERLVKTLEKDEKIKTKAHALKEIYKHLKPGETRIDEKAAESYLESLYFDSVRYDLARVGRYKFNKKLSLAARITGRVSAETVIDPATGEILAEEGALITGDAAQQIENSGIIGIYVEAGEKRIRVLGNQFVDAHAFLPFDPEKAGLREHVHYPTLMEALEVAKSQNMSDDETAEYLSSMRDALIPRCITRSDIIAGISYLLGMPYGIGSVDDIDHLGNRRIRSVGELLQNQMRQGLSRLEKTVHERMSAHDLETVTPTTLINTRPIMACIKEFFGSSQLSQFMDQTNPLAELTHKRRLSALGPGGLNRDRATFDVRDVHYSHYGRMCPIETPEGPNIGLINSLSTYARINEYGFIEAPYRKVDAKNKCILMDEIVYITADEEEGAIVAQASEPLMQREDGTTWFAHDHLVARQRDQIIDIDAEQVQYMDISPKQLISVATAMIPFLENDDANRALMGSNMQRQAVPLLVPEAPIVGTGMEHKAAYDSGVMVIAKEAGCVKSVSASCVVVEETDGNTREYNLSKFCRSNQGTCINQRPLVHKGQEVRKGDILADGASTDLGEIALGRNILIGFMTWEGYNYEDAVLISEELVRDDVYTSIHIEKYEAEARETKLGPEEITPDVTNVSAEAIKNLDERGIIRIGAEVHSGDILVGKVTPKGETELSPEERLLRAIFGDKSREVRDTSLRVPHGEDGIVVDVKIFTRDKRNELPPGVNQLVRVYIAQKRKISVGDKMAGRHGNKGVISRILPVEDMPFLPDGTPLQIVLNPLGVPSRMNIGQILELHLGIAAKKKGWHIATPVFDGAQEDDIEKLLCESYKVRNRQILTEQKGISESLADEILETTSLSDAHRARIIKELGASGEKTADEVAKLLIESGDGKTVLYDGRSGEPFENRVSVG